MADPELGSENAASFTFVLRFPSKAEFQFCRDCLLVEDINIVLDYIFVGFIMYS